MSWLIAALAAWGIVAVLLGLLVGNAIRIERGEDAERPARSDDTSGQGVPAAVAAGGSAAPAAVGTLTGAR